MSIEPVDPLEEDMPLSTTGSAATASAVTQTTTVKTETVVQPPEQVNKILATMSAFWDWFDKRDIDKHFVAIATLVVTFGVVRWSMYYASSNEARPGTDIAAILAAINVPLMTLQTAVIKWYFESRTTT